MIALAAWLDRQESRLRRGFERAGFSTAWLEEFRTYLNDPRMTLEEFWCRYTLLRMQEGPKLDAVTTEAEARAFYATSEYPLWRNLIHRRHSAWRRVLWTMRSDEGLLIEYGCGTAPVSRWVSRAKPRWTYAMIDLKGPARDFACDYFCRRRLAIDPKREGYLYRHGAEEADSASGIMWGRFDVAAALDVFEHLPDPVRVARDLVGKLAPGGYLHWNFVATDGTGLDLATSQQRAETIAYLTSALRTHYQSDDHMVSLKE